MFSSLDGIRCAWKRHGCEVQLAVQCGNMRRCSFHYTCVEQEFLLIFALLKFQMESSWSLITTALKRRPQDSQPLKYAISGQRCDFSHLKSAIFQTKI